MQEYNRVDKFRLVAGVNGCKKRRNYWASQLITMRIFCERCSITIDSFSSVYGPAVVIASAWPRIPAGHSTWDVMRVRAFKASIIHGRRVASGPRSKLEAIRSAITSIRSF